MIIAPINFDIPPIPKIEVERNARVSNNNFTTYSDSNYALPQVNFVPGQTIYVKIDTNSGNNVTAELVLLDSNKTKVSNIALANSGEFYSAEFTAPASGGVYYLHVEIRGDGTSFSGERNINVSGDSQTENNTYILSDVEQYVITDDNDSYLDENYEIDKDVKASESKSNEIIFLQFVWSIWDKLNNLIFW